VQRGSVGCSVAHRVLRGSVRVQRGSGGSALVRVQISARHPGEVFPSERRSNEEYGERPRRMHQTLKKSIALLYWISNKMKVCRFFKRSRYSNTTKFVVFMVGGIQFSRAFLKAETWGKFTSNPIFSKKTSLEQTRHAEGEYKANVVQCIVQCTYVDNQEAN
jgi:hypothetical protein